MAHDSTPTRSVSRTPASIGSFVYLVVKIIFFVCLVSAVNHAFRYQNF